MSTPRPFTPSQEPAADLDRRTVGRDPLLSTLSQRLTSAATGGSRPHTLLVGPRGTGKTHLLRVALHRAENTPSIAEKLLVAEVDEDALGITRYTDLLAELAGSIGLQLPRRSDAVATESAILTEAGDRTVILVIENLDRVFTAIGVSGQQNLRSWVETSGRIMILAATPSLFPAIQERSQPWFGGLITTPVDGLDAAAGRELLTLLARDAGNTELADFLQTDTGAARVRAIAQLTGGSPRIWMVLSECLTVENLDALIPAVEELVEGLVPYYQQLLWDLAPNHQSIVRELAEGPSAAQTAADVAVATGLTQQTVSKALGLLESGRWVKSEKVSGGDRRKTWYSLREPMLRHHFHWRSSRGGPLALIVEVLRVWYRPTQLRSKLADAEPNSVSEKYLLKSISLQPRSYDGGFANADPDLLLADARRWLGAGDDIYTRDCGRYVEQCVILARGREGNPADRLAQRVPAGPADNAVVNALSRTRSRNLGDLLYAAFNAAEGDTKLGLSLVVRSWKRDISPAEARELDACTSQSTTSAALSGALTLQSIRREESAHSNQLERLTTTLRELAASIGADHPLTLAARADIAFQTAMSGDPADALELYQRLMSDRLRVFGPETRSDPDTLEVRNQIAHLTAVTGNPALALGLYRELLSDLADIRAPDHPTSLLVRYEIANYSAETGSTVEAISLYRELVDDAERVWGRDHPMCLSIRSALADLTRQAGAHRDALPLYRDLFDARTRLFGADDPRTQYAKEAMIYLLARLDQPDEALTLALSEQPQSISGFIDVIATSRVAPSSPMLGLLWHAVRGDAEAEIRIEPELRPVAAEIRKIRGQGNADLTPRADTPAAP